MAAAVAEWILQRPTKVQLERARGARLPDVIGPELRVLFVGINPSLYSAAVGHHFARPGNRFWPTLHGAGWTPRLYLPDEDRDLVALGIGITNIVPRATARADELTADELARGGRQLARKVHRWKPATVAFVGITAYRAAFSQPGAKLGLQREKLGHRPIWLLPNTSGLNAHFQMPGFVRLFQELRLWLDG